MKQAMRTLLVVVSLVVTALLVSTAAANAGSSGTFVDDDGNPHEFSIETIAEAGITGGCDVEPPRYCPSDELTRAALAVMFVRAMGEQDKLGPYVGYFDDVPEDAWYAVYVERLYELGITQGCGTKPRAYCPDEPVLRWEMAYFVIRVIAMEGSIPTYQGYFDDVPEEAHYSGVVEGIHELGVTSGCSTFPSLYCPDDAVLRDQAATFIARTFDLFVR